jgi:hypothetical protein
VPAVQFSVGGHSRVQCRAVPYYTVYEWLLFVQPLFAGLMLSLLPSPSHSSQRYTYRLYPSPHTQ